MDTAALIQQLKKSPQIKLAILFGSQAKNTASGSSDIDLALWSRPSLTSQEKLQIISSLGAELNRPIDIIDLKTAGEPILGQVLTGKVLYGDKNLLAKLYTKHIIDSTDFLPLQDRILKERRDRWIQESSTKN